MIVEALLSLCLAPLLGLLSGLPDISNNFMEEWLYIRDTLMTFLQGVGCLVPITRFMPLLLFEISLDVFRLGYALFLRIKSFIPLIGGGT